MASSRVIAKRRGDDTAASTMISVGERDSEKARPARVAELRATESGRDPQEQRTSTLLSSKYCSWGDTRERRVEEVVVAEQGAPCETWRRLG